MNSSARHRDRVAARFAPLDGIRAFAVALVCAFHAGLSWAPGGLFGVDIFFVLSGYLITGLLLSEHARRGGLNFGGFWGRRARRLLPAMLIMLVTTLLVWRATAPPTELAGLRQDAVATLAYVANWHFSLAGQGYFAQGAAPSPMLHMWSLAVEEQFYLFWPIIVALVLRGRTPARGRHLLRIVTVAGAVGSTILMAALADAGVSTTRLYYGTDTRAATLLVGAALATVLPLGGRRAGSTAAAAETADAKAAAGAETASAKAADAKAAGVTQAADARDRDDTVYESAADAAAQTAGGRQPWILGTVGIAAALALGWILTHVGGQSAWLYRGGFLLVAVLAAAVIAGAVGAPEGPLALFLAIPPLRALGRISYGVYLWHWPVILFLTHARTGSSGYSLLALRMAVTITLAALSWTLVEQPIQQAFRSGHRGRRGFRPNWVGATVLAGLLALAVGVAAIPNPSTGARVETGSSMTASSLSGSARAGSSFGTTSGVDVPQHVDVRPIGNRPVRVDLVGDSQAFALWSGIRNFGLPAKYDIKLDGDGLFACGVEGNSAYKNEGQTVEYHAAPGGLGDCSAWEQSWQHNINVADPDVVLLALGRWEMVDRYWDGGWHNIEDGSGYANWVLGQLKRGLQILQSHGAKVAVLETPCYQEEQPDGSPYPEVSPSRLARFRQLQRMLVAESGQDVQLVSANSLLCPGGKYTTDDPQGRQIRNTDGIHVVDLGGAEVGDLLLPQLIAWAKDGTVPTPPSS